jgi:DNA polymerase beta
MTDTAKKLKLHLNSHGLWSWHSNENDSLEDVWIDSLEDANGNDSLEDAYQDSGPSGHWRLMKCETEHDIFKELGMDFVEPEKRNFLFMWKRVGKSKSKSKDIPD